MAILYRRSVSTPLIRVRHGLLMVTANVCCCLALQNLIQVIQADFNRRAEAARDETASVVLPGQAYEPMIRMVDFQELLTTYEIGLNLKIDVKGMIKDIRKFQLADSMFLASS